MEKSLLIMQQKMVESLKPNPEAQPDLSQFKKDILTDFKDLMDSELSKLKP